MAAGLRTGTYYGQLAGKVPSKFAVLTGRAVGGLDTSHHHRRDDAYSAGGEFCVALAQASNEAE